MTQNEELQKKWKDWIEIIDIELGTLLRSKDIVDEIRRIAAINNRIKKPMFFYNWLVDNYVDSISMAIRRLDDHDEKSISLYRLIKNVLDNPKVIDRNYFVSQYPRELQDDGNADADFDTFAEGGEQTISLDRFNDDPRQLKKEAKCIRDFADMRIAHYDRRREELDIPTHKDVGIALQKIDELFCKYKFLVAQIDNPTCKRPIQNDWKEPLRHAWLTKDYEKIIAHRIQKVSEDMS